MRVHGRPAYVIRTRQAALEASEQRKYRSLTEAASARPDIALTLHPVRVYIHYTRKRGRDRLLSAFVVVIEAFDGCFARLVYA